MVRQTVDLGNEVERRPRPSKEAEEGRLADYL